MNITTQITCDVSYPGSAPVVNAVQYDTNSRYVAMTITDGGVSYNIPSGAIGLVKIEKPDGKVCAYEYLPDGTTPAVALSGNTATLLLVPQALTVYGDAYCGLSLYNVAGEELSTFYFRLIVEKSPVPDTTILSSNYYSILTQEIAAVLGAQSSILDMTVSSSTLSEGSEATVAKTVVDDIFNLHFGIPKGDKGDKGDKGATGPQGPQGNTGPQGVQGSKGNTGSIGPQGPQGIQGLKGDKGDKGDTGESGVTVPITGLFHMSVDAAGNLYVTSQTDLSDAFYYDSTTGNLYYQTGE